MTAPATQHIAERLTTFTWLRCIWPRLRAQCTSQENSLRVSLYYVDGTRFALRLARLMCKRIGIKPQRLHFDAARMYDPEGLLIWLRTYYRDLQHVLECIDDLGDFPGKVTADRALRNRQMYLRKSCVPGPPLFGGAGAWRSVFLTLVSGWHARNEKPEASAIVLYLQNHPWFPALQRYADAVGPISLVPCGSAFRPSTPIARVLARDLRLLAEGWFARLPREHGTNCEPSSSSAAIAVQYYGHFNLGSPQLHSDFFFWQQSELRGRNIVGLFALPQDRLDAARAQELTRFGIRGIALRPSATTLARLKYTRTDLRRNAGRAARMGLHAFAEPRRAWTAAHNDLFDSEVAYWSDVLSYCNARIFLTWFKYTADHCAIAEAIQRKGGVLALYQRSFEGNPSPQTAVIADLAFGFSSLSAAVERGSGSRIDCYVITGYLGDHRYELLRPAATRLRRMLQNQGAQFIIAYFDESSFPDARWGIGPERTRANYRSVLEKLISEPNLGVILKPKTPRTLRARLGNVTEILDAALRTGRCHLIEEGAIQGSAPPAQAALASDVAVHESVASATAAQDAALAGVPTLIMDHDGWTISPLYRLGEGSVIFRDWNALWEKLESLRATESPQIGDWSDMLDELDPFRDGRAAERMGTFLKWLIECFEKGASRDVALADAAARYVKIWGADKIVRISPSVG